MEFLNQLFQYGIKYIFFIAVAVGGVLVGKKLKDRKLMKTEATKLTKEE